MSDSLNDILGSSEQILRVKSIIHQVAPSDITVLINGESGTGKELVARAIHDLSNRRKRKLINVNCGAIPEGIFESEVFGHEKGSFTSAEQRRQGYFEMADGGTLFLDEIGEMPLSVQVKILRVLENGIFLRVGGSKEIRVDVRIIAATNKDLEAEVNQGKFRGDLYYRLNAVNIVVPPLRERSSDIHQLINYFVDTYSQRNNRPAPRIDEDALDLMRRHYWSGNVRELKNFVESLIALSHDNVITYELVSGRLNQSRSSLNLPVVVRKPAESSDRDMIYSTLLELKYDMNTIKQLLQELIYRTGDSDPVPFGDAEEVEAYSLDDVEREQIRKVLAELNGNRRMAAKALGIGERTLYRKIKQYDL